MFRTDSAGRLEGWGQNLSPTGKRRSYFGRSRFVYSWRDVNLSVSFVPIKLFFFSTQTYIELAHASYIPLVVSKRFGKSLYV